MSNVCLGLVNSLSASFNRWQSNSRGRRAAAHDSSVVSDQSVFSTTSDSLPSTGLSADAQNADCKVPEVAGATPRMIRKRKAGVDLQPFSASKKLVRFD